MQKKKKNAVVLYSCIQLRWDVAVTFAIQSTKNLKVNKIS